MNIRANELINSEIYVREPVDKFKNEINSSKKDKIILTGGRGTGKSVVLNELQQKGLGTENQTVLMRFDSVICFNKSPTEFYPRNFFINYYELEMADFLLDYIRKYYGLYYEKHFCKYSYDVKDGIKKALDYANNGVIDNRKYLHNLLETGEITTNIINDMKNIIGIDKLNVAFDRFDWTNGKSQFSQILLKKYFNLFDKSIITTDDENLDKNKYLNNGYDIISLDYGKDINVIKKIIQYRIDLFCKKYPNVHIDYNKLNDNIINYLISNSNGNISTIVTVINNFLPTYEWCGGIDNYFDIINYETQRENDTVKLLKKMGPQPRLWI